ncbi:MAG: transposase [Burkholderiales bacterium]|nr:transposase [Burkholderiales bacterium]
MSGRVRTTSIPTAQECLGKPGRFSLRYQQRTPARKVTFFHQRMVDLNDPSYRMKQAIDSTRGRALYSQRIATVEPVFGNIRHNKRLSRFNLRGQEKVNTQWHLYRMVHNIEKLPTADG